MTFSVDILTLFPEMFPGPFGSSILKRAMQDGRLGVRLHQIRDYTHDRHHTVDDYPYGGGAGMVMKAPPLFEAVEAVLALPPSPPGLCIAEPTEVVSGQWSVVRNERSAVSDPLSAISNQQSASRRDGGDTGTAVTPQYAIRNTQYAPRVVLLSPAGRVFTQEVAAELAALPRIVLVCGHYEGVDERVREHLVTDEISIGDYVLTGGELAAMVVVDAAARLVPGVLAEGSAEDESHTSGLLEYPQYTRPAVYRGWSVPPVLVSGHHAQVAAWRRSEAIRLTTLRRPDMLGLTADTTQPTERTGEHE